MHASLSEILLILLVALIVIKPEQLPTVAFTLGKWVKWFQQTISQVKEEITLPLRADKNHEQK